MSELTIAEIALQYDVSPAYRRLANEIAKAIAIEMASRTAANAETLAQDAAKKAATAKERIARLNNGETLTGGLGTPRALTRQDFINRAAQACAATISGGDNKQLPRCSTHLAVYPSSRYS